MNKRLTGSIFILISAILFSTRYIVASMAFIEYNEYSDFIFKQILKDNTLVLFELSIISLIIGIAYICKNYLEETNKRLEKKKNQQ